MLDLLIKGGTIIDGIRVPRYKADIGIRNGIIVDVGLFGGAEAGEVVDADGLIVAPGFIDSHTHSDISLLKDPQASAKIAQGVTTEVVGNCGMSVAPVGESTLGLLQEYVQPVLGSGKGIWDWYSIEEYMRRLEEVRPAVNVALIMGHGTLRTAVMGFANREPSPNEMGKMKEILASAMELGVLGISTGLGYPPGIFAKTDELVELSKVVGTYGGIYATHLRDQVDGLIESVAEAIEIGEKASVQVIISHHKTVGKANFGKVAITLDMLDRAQMKGLSNGSDTYPYIAGSTTLAAIFPPWSVEGGIESLMNRLRQKEHRERIKMDFQKGLPGWENRSKAIGWENIIICHVGSDENSDLDRKSLFAAAESRGENPADFSLNLMLEEKGNVGVILNNSTELDLLSVMKHPRTMIGSDGINVGANPHPRVYGTFPKFIGEYVRDKQIFSLEEGIWKITGLPASQLHIEGLGAVKKGYRADLTVFDLEKVNAVADYNDSRRLAVGMSYVIVGGKVVYQKGSFTGIHSGAVLKRGKK